jgi:VanZ family protein
VAVDLPGNPLWLLLHSWPADFNRFFFRDTVVNVALYVPAGLTGHLAFRKFGKTWISLLAPVLICTVLSASVEMIQLFVPPRNTNAMDLLTNIVGSIAGVFLGTMLEDFLLQDRARKFFRRTADRAALSLLACWAAWLLFPLFPVLGRAALRHKFDIFIHSPVVDPVPFLSAALVWFVVGSLFQASAVRSPRWLTPISVVMIPAQYFIVDRQPAPAELAGAAVGAACYALFWPRRKDARPTYRTIQAFAFLCVIVVRGLAPFVFVRAPFPFSWIPFTGFLGADWQTGIQLIAQKFFWYGTAIWLLRASGLRIRTATALVAATLLLIEIAQTHLPGRTAEITDPLWGIFAGWSIWLLSRQKAQAKGPLYTDRKSAIN